MFEDSIGNDFEQIALDIHRLISVEVSKKFQLYSQQQRAVFRSILDLIDQLDLTLTSKDKIKHSYFKTYKMLFAALRQINFDQTINNKIAEIKYRNPADIQIFMQFINQDSN